MPNIELKIRHQRASKIAAAARFVQGQTSQAWLAEIERWPLAHQDLRLIPVAQKESNQSSACRRKLLGVLVFSCDAKPLSGLPGVTNALNYGCLGGRFYLPCNGAIYPNLNPDELEDLMIAENVYLWHPAVGLLAAAPNGVFTISDLLSSTAPPLARWEHARQGIFLESRLQSLSLEPPAGLTAQSVLTDGQDDIGEHSEDLKNLAPSPDERASNPTGQISHLSQSLMRSFAKMIQNATQWAPANADRRTWINGVEDWATAKLNGISQKLERERFKELYRLQNLLKNDPDQGLKYALPLNSDAFNRGVASPSARLGRRNVDFSLSGLRGGGATDAWDIPHELQNQLTNQYRTLAGREARLGRHRRAAYIYGELLNDMNAAARTLETGKHYREAAVIYRKKLNRDDEAARCLERGGLWTEAIELYDELKQFEKSGDLYAQLDNQEQSQNSYLTARKAAVDKRDFLDAARIEKDKLQDTDAAIETLKRGWPGHHQAVQCLKKSFQVMASAGQHESAKQWLTEVANGRISKQNLNQTVKVISELANHYPDQSTCDLATEKTYQIVSQTIENGRMRDPASLLSSVARLHPADELLHRDCDRFGLKSFGSKAKATAKSNQGSASRKVELVRSVKLPRNFQWVNAIALGDGFLAVAKRGRNAKVVRLSADIEQTGEFSSALSADTTLDFILSGGGSGATAVVHLPSDRRFASRQVLANESSTRLKGDKRLSLDANTIGITEGGFGQWQILRYQKYQLLLETVATNGELVNSRVFSHNPVEHDAQTPVPMYHDGDKLFIGMGKRLVTSKGYDRIDTLELPEPTVGMAGSVRKVSTRVALSFDYGFRVLWEAYDSKLSGLMSDTLYRPKLLFTSAGYLIAADEDQCEVYRSSAGSIEWMGKIETNGCRALMRTNQSNGFALLNDEGAIEIYRI